MLRIEKNEPSWRRRLLQIGGGAAAIGLLIYGVAGYWDWFKATQQHRAETPGVVVVSTDQPDEKLPEKPCFDYSSGAQTSVEITIPRIETRGCIQSVGIDQHNNIAVPTNIHLAGWYTGSPSPGEKGVSLIDGHVLGRYNDAIFKDLHLLAPNDEVSITKNDGTTLTFTVVDTQSYRTEDTMSRLLEPIEGVDRQLTLITCIGTYDKGANTYDKRLVVRTKLREALQ